MEMQKPSGKTDTMGMHSIRKESWVYRFLCFCVVVLFTLITTEPTSGATTLRFGLGTPPHHPWTVGIMNLIERVEKDSNGRVRIEVVQGVELRNPLVLLHRVQENSIDLGLLRAEYLSETVKAMRIFSLPFAFRDKIQARIATSGRLAEDLLNESKKQGLISLDFLPSESTVLINGVRPIRNLADFKGLKIATGPDPIQREAIKALGAEPIPVARGGIYTALEKGALSGVTVPPSFSYKTKFYKFAKYMSAVSINYVPGVIIASPKTWSRVPLEQRELIERTVSEIARVIDPKLELRSAFAIKKMKEEGVAVYYPKEGEISALRKAVEPVYMSAREKMPIRYWQVAYNAAYVSRDLEVCSRPKGATVLYRRDGDKEYEKHHRLTDTNITLEYAVWQIRAEKEKFKPEEKYFNPYRTRRWRVDFDLKRIR